jgi:hexokinase
VPLSPLAGNDSAVGFTLHSVSILYLAGGTNLRVCLVTLQGEGKFEITQSKYRLTEEQKQEDGQKLFDFCAECLKTFLDANVGNEDSLIKHGQELPLGFTVRLIIQSAPVRVIDPLSNH